MIDLNKLNSQVDLNNIDLDQILKGMREHQNTVIKIVVIVAALIAAGLMFNDHRVKDHALRVKISEAQQKLDAIKAREASLKGLTDFKSSLPKKINEFELITLISGYAKSYHISIPSLSPAESEDKGLYDVINVKFTALPDNFKDLMFFLRKIEKSEFPLRVDSLSAEQEPGGGLHFHNNDQRCSYPLMIKLMLLMMFLMLGSYPLKADDTAGGEQDFDSQLDNIKSPFEDGIPKPVIPVPVHHEESRPVVRSKPKHSVPVVPLIRLPELEIQGVIVGEDIHQAIIDDQVVPLQGKIKGVTVISVTKRGVGLLYKGKKFFLTVD